MTSDEVASHQERLSALLAREKEMSFVRRHDEFEDSTPAKAREAEHV